MTSTTAPVADWYALNASIGYLDYCNWFHPRYAPVARRMKVVPVSTIPAVFDRIVLVPYVMLWLKPQ